MSGGQNIDGSDIFVGLIENLEPPGDERNDAVELTGDEDKSVLITLSDNLEGLILNLPDADELDAGDLANEVSLIEPSSARLLSSANECEDPDGFKIPFNLGRSIELLRNPYNLNISAGFLGTES